VVAAGAQALMTIPTIPTLPTIPALATLRSILGSRSVLLAGAVALIASAIPATAAADTRTWSGAAGPVNNQWTIGANWQGGVAPVANDDLVFPAGAVHSVTANNFPAGTTFGSITFNAAYTVTGNAIAVTGAGSATVTFGLPIAIASAPDLIVTVGDTATLALSGQLSGAAGLTKSGTGTLRLIGSSSNVQTGLTTVTQGTLVLARISPAIAVPAGLTVGNANGGASADVVRLETAEQIAGQITVTGSGLLDLANMNQTVTTTLIVQGGRITTGAGVLTLNADISAPTPFTISTIEGQLSLGGATRTIHVVPTTFPGVDIKAIVVDGGGAAGLIKTGTGRVRLAAANTYSGVTTIQEGGIMVAHPQALGSTAAGTAIETLGTLRVESDIAAEPIEAQNTTGGAVDLLRHGGYILARRDASALTALTEASPRPPHPASSCRAHALPLLTERR
jgi:autotransporter-associated beta strand protein